MIFILVGLALIMLLFIAGAIVAFLPSKTLGQLSHWLSGSSASAKNVSKGTEKE